MAYAIIKHDMQETGIVHDRREQFLIDSIDDVQNLPSDSAPGSIAYFADRSRAWQMSPSKVWTEVVDVSLLLNKLAFWMD